MKNYLDDNEYIVADNAYADGMCLQPPGDQHAAHGLLSRIRARHEIVNASLKIFNVLNAKFRHTLNRHRICFMAVINITCLSLEARPLFTISYDPNMELRYGWVFALEKRCLLSEASYSLILRESNVGLASIN